MRLTVVSILIGELGTVPMGLEKGVGIFKTSQDHPNYSIVEVGQKTEKSPGDLRRLVVTQTPVKNHQLMR